MTNKSQKLGISHDLLLTILPSVPFEERDQLPQASGIYFALSAADEVLYVGSTNNLKTRLYAHHRVNVEQAPECVKIAYYCCPCAELPILETAMIRQFNPPLNRSVPRKYMVEPTPTRQSVQRHDPKRNEAQQGLTQIDVDALCDAAKAAWDRASDQERCVVFTWRKRSYQSILTLFSMQVNTTDGQPVAQRFHEIDVLERMGG